MAHNKIQLRQSAIIKKLKKFSATRKEIESYLELESEIFGYDLRTSAKTFERDIASIRVVQGISIEYDFSKKKYYIQEEQNNEHNNRMLEAFDTFNALNLSIDLSRYLQFERRKSVGLDYFLPLLNAIKNQNEANLSYQTYWDKAPSLRKVEPYLLKEFKNRWYLIAKDISKNEIRTYGLERIINLDVSKKKFNVPENHQPENYFESSFGIISRDGEQPIQTIILSFDEQQAKYVKSMPLHVSQVILKDTGAELLIQLEMYITFDFEMELLSYGEHVEVIETMVLRDSLKNKLQTTLNYYG
ncbi:putative DNA-binding transcriptional regulator YafY [Pedobacter sp. UYP30]|uniref:helix-turn-helix transcriptional regulator n=1 Tax=Pedobacter sp. UYP30 TaxID=1756400 RepID=UPI0033995712